MLDNLNLLAQRDPSGTRFAAAHMTEQVAHRTVVAAADRAEVREVRQVVLAGMGGSALAADMIKVLVAGWLHIPVEVVKGYELPGYSNHHTLVITLSHSGNTEETISCYTQAKARGCMLAAVATGGQLLALAEQDKLPHVIVPKGGQPRMASVYHLKAVMKLLELFAVIDGDLYQRASSDDMRQWLERELSAWAPEVPTSSNPAKQLALQLIGKTPAFYGGELTWPLAYKWKISCNESAKNTAYHNQYPEFNHNEFMGWTSHPIEKPFAIVDIRSSLERPRIRERMELSDRLLSGMRPKATVIELQGKTLLHQLLWGLSFADITTVYTGILNGVNPEPVALIERFKKELSPLN